MPFTISTATITDVAPAIAAPGASVTISGSGFGASQGAGQAWLGGAIATIQSWNDGQIVAQIPAGATGSGARVLQNGVMSNAGTFTVDALLLTGILPTAGSNPPSFTLTGTGFGTAPGMVWLGDRAGNAASWTDTQVVATADPSANSGVAKIQKNGVWSNAKPFILAVPGGNTVVPSAINMVVGDTRSIQALNSSSQPVTGLTWTSSNPNIVSLSTADPPVLTALAAGNVTITAGTGSADVTVYAGALPLGTVIWSNPGDGAGVSWIVPAVPSASGVADVFAFQNDGTVQAIKSDGTTAWTADVGNVTFVWQPRFGWGIALPDFQGGLVVDAFDYTSNTYSIWKLDGMTGQAYPTYTASGNWLVGALAAIHPDGTIFAFNGYAVVGIDPTTGTAKFSVPMLDRHDAPIETSLFGGSPFGDEGNPIGSLIAGDGYFYLYYVYRERRGQYGETQNIDLLRIGTDGTSGHIPVVSFDTNTFEWDFMHAGMITNGDTGVLLTWEATSDNIHYTNGLAVVSGANVSLVPGPQLPGQSNGTIAPVLQAQDGSFVGIYDWCGQQACTPYMVSFNASGNVRWVVPNDTPQIATADGGVIGQSGITYDANGNATGTVGLFTPSWFGNAYQVGSVDQVLLTPYFVATSFWAFQGGNRGQNNTAFHDDMFPPLPTCHTPNTCQACHPSSACTTNPQPNELIYNAWSDLVSQLQAGTPCYNNANPNFIFRGPGILGSGALRQPLNFASFVQYLSKYPRFYDGSRSTLGYGWALNGGSDTPLPGISEGRTVRGQFSPSDPGSTTTAVTVTPHTPFISFWQPGYYGTDSTGFGVGIAPTNGGVNIYNESVIFHEALHGFSGSSDSQLESDVLSAVPQGVGGSGSEPISIYIQKYVLNMCPINGGK
jgi:hypothetical protein